MKTSIYLGGWLALLMAVSACTEEISVKAIEVKKMNVQATVTTISTGTVKAQREAALGFGTSGRISKIYVQRGGSVKEGQIIAEIENRDLQVARENALSELKRNQKLFREKLASQVELDQARRSYESANSQWTKTRITTPFGGLVTEMNLEVGELWQMGSARTEPSVHIVDHAQRIVEGDIDEADMAKVKVGQKASIRVLAVRAKPMNAVVSRVVPYVNSTREQDRSCRIEIQLLEDDILVPVGASAEVEIITASKSGVLAVPSHLVFKNGKGQYVYRSINGILRKQLIKTGLGNYDRVEVISGLNEKDLVLYPSDGVELSEGTTVQSERVQWP